ncbi:hypothetical protein D9756_005773 [Leucocoprinus leucothites]|uniref:Bromo domain-containing protein n=1 Tax=Leucocoprinus leucothites TaxID=201217 RepID=A0A8H5D9D6_9AGAR|nr:hypothetical protein D9756_005773 [Leucoagaricus leucothites]
MNNLLRTLTESNARPPTDLRLLLNTVKEGRKQCADSKLSDAFYDALEGLLIDLKSITLDNRDAEAFLKPVSKAEVPDYYEVIANPMDFQTMLKKVKQKQYKSKREFKDDLDLIWSNCYTYNASENHPLRQCVKRLKAKADRLLKHITDRRERTDPIIPPELGAEYTGLLPKMNGVSRTHTRSPSYTSTKGGTPGLATVKPLQSIIRQSTFNPNIPFDDSPAITRTPEGMGMFYELDAEVAAALKKPNPKVLRRLRELAPSSLLDDEVQDEADMGSPKEEDMIEVDGIVGDKRKLLSLNDQNNRPRKRARFVTPYPAPLSPGQDPTKDELSELWWAAAQSDALLANGVPPIPFGPASSKIKARPSSSSTSYSSSSFPPSTSSLVPSSSSSPFRHPDLHPPSSIPKPKPKSKRRKKQDVIANETPPTHIENPKALLNLMNANIKTMRRVRHTHGKFAALNATTITNEDAEDGTAVAVAGGSGSVPPVAGPSSGDVGAFAGGLGTIGEALNAAADDEILNEKVDEKPWVMMQKGKGKGKGKEREQVARVGGVEVGEKNAWGCLQWTNQKVLEHVGFQGTTQVSLDVMSGILAEYISNVGRTIKFMSDKYAGTMTPEEIILHTLFESGNSKVQDLERYVRDDVERYSSRLNELEKKIVGAYRETTAGETLEDEGLFMEEDEEETGALAIGDFADMLGEDYLGLRELGIAAEFGMSSLSIPKKLLKGKKNQNKGGPAASKPNEPPPPYPPPPPFVPLKSSKVDDQIGLLQGYYTGRFTALAQSQAAKQVPGPLLPPPPLGVLPLAGPTLSGLTLSMPSLPEPTLSQPPPPPGPSLAPTTATPAVSAPGLPSSNTIAVPGAVTSTAAGQQQVVDLASMPGFELSDDAPSGPQAKMGPLGQIARGGGAGAGKKKAKGASGAGSGAGGGGAGPTSTGTGATGGLPLVGSGAGGNATNGGAAASPVVAAGVVEGTPSPSKKKKGAATGVGTGNGRKKKGPDASGSQQQGGNGGGQGSPYPPVVVASA